MITVVTVCGDPGGAKAIVPVLQLLEVETDIRLCNFAYNEGKNVLHYHGITFVGLSQSASEEHATNYLKEVRATYVLSATSCNHVNWERAFLSAASQLEIRSLAVLDFWSNYQERFADDQKTALTMPDQLAVMDERARTEAISAGLPARCLVVTGQPAFDALDAHRKQFNDAAKRQLHDSFAFANDELVVMFVSQPLRKMHEEYGATNQGFDEFLVAREVLATLEAITHDTGCHITLLVRPHPRENSSSYEWLRSDHVRIRISSDGDSREVVMAADLVVGMNSVLLLEACHLGAVVVSIQLGMKGVDSLFTNLIGASHPVYEKKMIREGLETYLLDSRARHSLRSKAANLCSEADSARRVADLVLRDMRILDKPTAITSTL